MFNKKLFILILVVVFSLCVGGYSVAETPPKEIRLMYTCSPSGSPYLVLGATIAKVVREAFPEITITVGEGPGSKGNVFLLRTDEADIGLGTDVANSMGYYGEGDEDFEKAGPFSEMRYIFPKTITAFSMYIREDAGIDSIYGLDGRPYCPGNIGGIIEQMTLNTFKTLGVNPEYVAGSQTDNVANVKDGRVLGLPLSMVGTTSPGSWFEEINVLVPLKPLTLTEDEVKKVLEANPHYQSWVVPANVFRNQPEPYPTLGYGINLFGTSRLSEEIVYKIVKALWEDHEKLVEVMPQTAECTPETALNQGVPLHAGVVKYYNEIGITIPDRLLPPEAK